MSYRNRKNHSGGKLDSLSQKKTSCDSLTIDDNIWEDFEENDSVVFVTEADEEDELDDVEIEDIFAPEPFSSLSKKEMDRMRHFPSSLVRKQKSLRLRLHETAAKRTKKRDLNGISIEERKLAKVYQPMPNHEEVKQLENLLALLFSFVDRIEANDSRKEPIKARAAVFVSCAALEVSNLLNNTLAIHSEEIQSSPAPKATKLRKSRKWKRRKNTSILQRSLEKELKKLVEVSMAYKSLLFKKIEYTSVEEGNHPLSCVISLKESFLALNSRIAAVANKFYSSETELFNLKEEVDTSLIYLCKYELETRLMILSIVLEKASKTIQKMESFEISMMSLPQALQDLDNEGLSFVCPFVLPNIAFVDDNLIHEGSLSIVGYLESRKEKFCSLLTTKNFLTYFEIQVLI